MMSLPETITEMIESRTYLLDFQRRQLVEDLEKIPTDDEHIGKIMDAVLFRLFNRGWNDLTGLEIQDILNAWKESK